MMGKDKQRGWEEKEVVMRAERRWGGRKRRERRIGGKRSTEEITERYEV